MRSDFSGFTLIELVIVIIIIAILAVVVLPRYLNLTSNAQVSTTNAIAGALSSGNANNYAARKINSSLGVSITNCTNVANVLQSGLPSNYTITSLVVAADTTVICTLTGLGGTTASFTATGVP